MLSAHTIVGTNKPTKGLDPHAVHIQFNFPSYLESPLTVTIVATVFGLHASPSIEKLVDPSSL
jgi:hypothetical protein